MKRIAQNSKNILLFMHCVLLCVATQNQANEYAEKQGQDALLYLLETHPDVMEDYFPDKESKEVYHEYRISYPPIEDYAISMLVNPCGVNGTHGRNDNIALGYDCCMSRFGSGEYSYKRGTRNKFSDGYSNGLPLSSDEPLHNGKSFTATAATQ
eukprot:scaffold10558_cov70-Cyclotella_meneghiniana.AAC.3